MSSPPPDPQAPWYEKAFKIQMLLLIAAAGVVGPVMAFVRPQQIPQFPRVPFVQIFMVMGVLGAFVCGFLVVQMVRHLLWLFGRGPCVETWIGPPPRVNCAMMALLGLVFIGMGIEMVFAGGPAPLMAIALLGGPIIVSFSLTGFLWAHAEARKPCQKT